jgi:hypothetical protein
VKFLRHEAAAARAELRCQIAFRFRYRVSHGSPGPLASHGATAAIVTSNRINRSVCMTASAIPGESIDLQIADLLGEVQFPTNKDALVDAAREAGASNEVLSMLDGLPEQDYADVGSVTRLVSGNYGPGLSG